MWARYPPSLSLPVLTTTMDYCSCGGDGSVLHPECILFDFDPFLTGDDQPINEEGTNGELSMYSLVGGPPIDYEHPTGSNEVIDDYGFNSSYLAPGQPSINTHLPNAENYLVGSSAMRIVSSGRRLRSVITCPFPGCAANFTARHNYNCPYFFTGNISSN